MLAFCFAFDALFFHSFCFNFQSEFLKHQEAAFKDRTERIRQMQEEKLAGKKRQQDEKEQRRQKEASERSAKSVSAFFS